jgi:TatD DNase family protein
MFVDSHCHINFADFQGELSNVTARMAENQVTHALCVSVNLRDWPSVMAVAHAHANIYGSVGVHPDHEGEGEPTVEELGEKSKTPKVVAIGETGLDYYRLTGDLEWQRERFRTHIRAARAAGLPLIVHSRAAPEDTLRIMREEGAQAPGGVMHCFTESWEVAAAAIELNFYISFSGIVTFKSAAELREVARKVPLARMLIETDSPYLAPVPFRGKTNEPALVKYVAEEIARIKNLPVEEVARVTSENFFRLFSIDASA